MRPLAGCEAGTIIYVFTAGEVTVHPYRGRACRDRLLPPDLPALLDDVLRGAFHQPVILHA